MQVKAALPTDLLEGNVRVIRWSIPRKAIFPCVLVLIALAGIFSPLFNLHDIHGVPTARLFSQHLYFDSISDAGGFYAATLCKHWYHKIPVAIAFALISTFCLVTLVG